MRREFISVAPQESLAEARQIMRMARLRHLVVVQGSSLVGLLTYRDLVDFLFSEAARGAATSGLRVEEAMVRFPQSVSPDRTLAYAASRLWQLQLGCLPVVEADENGGRLVGLITEVDLLRAAYDPLHRALR
jgi:CBS domain-containing protein